MLTCVRKIPQFVIYGNESCGFRYRPDFILNDKQMRNETMLASRSWFQEDFWFLNVLLLFKIKCLNYWPLELHFSDHVFRSKGRSQSCLEEETQLRPALFPGVGAAGEWGGAMGWGGGRALKGLRPFRHAGGEAVAVDTTPPLRCWPDLPHCLWRAALLGRPGGL